MSGFKASEDRLTFLLEANAAGHQGALMEVYSEINVVFMPATQ